METLISGDRASSAPAWSDLRPGARLTVVKLAPDGAEAARYPGEVVGSSDPGRWRIVLATWSYSLVEFNGLSFHPGDQLLEWFSPDFPFNAFAVFSPDERLRGWYANVTLPAYLESRADDEGRPVLVWHDYYLDLVGLTDGSFAFRDEDELEASTLRERDPGLYRRVVDAGNELTRRFIDRRSPFGAPEHVATCLQFAKRSKIRP